MSKEKTITRYHPAHVTVHWLMFLLVVMMLVVGKYIMPGVPADDPQKALMLKMHTYTGALIAILLVVRVILRFTIKRPLPADAGNAFLNILSRIVHFSLYFFLVGMAFSGLGLFQMADLPAIFDGTVPYPQDFYQYLPRMGHGMVSTLLLLLIILHFGAAMYHQFMRKDNILARMWYGK
jgi:cytochrome b561